jgi:hypothetical protein
MTSTKTLSHPQSWVPLGSRPGTRTAAAHPRRWLRWLGFLAVAGCLVFCHGCHGEDEDDELRLASLPLSAPAKSLGNG